MKNLSEHFRKALIDGVHTKGVSNSSLGEQALSIRKCRSLLQVDCKLTDLEIEQLRYELYALSDILLDAYSKRDKKNSQTVPHANGVESCLEAVLGSERGEVEERAAILEFDAGFRRPEAERQAFGEWAQRQQTGKNKRKQKKTARGRNRGHR